MALPHGTTGSLRPAFAAARAVALAVKLPSAFTLVARLPTALREPLRASVTVSEATAPVKLPACRGPRRGFTRRRQGFHVTRGVFHRWLQACRNRRLAASHLPYARSA